MTDRDLLALCRAGSPDAFDRLVETHYDYLLGLCWRITGDRAAAEDSVQEAYLRMIRSIDRLDPRPSLRPWLRRVATNICLDQIAKSKQRAEIAWLDLADGGADGSDAGINESAAVGGANSADLDPVARQVVERSEIAAVAAAMSDLNGQQRAILSLKVVDGLSYEAISDILGMPIGTVKSHLARARAKLRQTLATGGDADA